MSHHIKFVYDNFVLQRLKNGLLVQYLDPATGNIEGIAVQGLTPYEAAQQINNVSKAIRQPGSTGSYSPDFIFNTESGTFIVEAKNFSGTQPGTFAPASGGSVQSITHNTYFT